MFFEQKTAYEMRISDWSSDVCSSDLRRAGRPQYPRLSVARRARPARGHAAGARDLRHAQLAAEPGSRHRADRKSVVEGKSVSVRVTLGGRRIIKKKKSKLYQNTRTVRLKAMCRQDVHPSLVGS